VSKDACHARRCIHDGQQKLIAELDKTPVCSASGYRRADGATTSMLRPKRAKTFWPKSRHWVDAEQTAAIA